MSAKLDVDVLLLDIEGTICPISFVKDVLFPYAIQALDALLPAHWNSPTFTPYRDAFAPRFRASPSVFLAHVHDLITRDIKDPALKSLQGYLWLSGYESGEIRCPLFPDVYPALKRWKEQGKLIVIYSSGSVAAQKLLFQYTNIEAEPDLRPYLSAYYDTINAGNKREKESYDRIAKSGNDVIGRWLFLSDHPAEVEAAIQAGMKSLVVVRKGNAPLSVKERTTYEVVETFDQIELAT